MKSEPEKFDDKLKEKGYKITSQRKTVLDVIKENEGKHFNSEEIYSLVKEKIPDIGIATIYRTLSLLEKMGLIYKVNLGTGSVKYELDRRNTSHRHHHLVCLNCREIIEVEEDLLDNIEERIKSKHNFIIKDHSVKFYGYCSRCCEKYQDK